MGEKETLRLCRKMEHCWNGNEIDMTKVNNIVSEFYQLPDFEKSCVIAYCCGQLSGYRRKLDILKMQDMR